MIEDQTNAGSQRALSRRFIVVIAALLFAVTVVRGLHLASVLMPFEGWDEYQHLAVADFLAGKGRMPSARDPVQPEFRSFIRAHPHPDRSAEQVGGIGGRNYAGKVWSGDEWVDPAPDRAIDRPPHLYQAQHGPLYYRFLVLLKRALGITDLLAWADAARIANVIFAALMLVVWFVMFSIVFANGPTAILPAAVCTAVAANSLFIFNAARAANDPLANLLASVTLLVYVRALASPRIALGWRPFVLAAILGALTGLTVLTKAFGLAILPVFALSIPWVMRARGRRFTTGIALVATLLLAYLVVAGSYHQRCLRELGTLTGMQEAARNQVEGRSIGDILDELPTITSRTLSHVFLRGQFCIGGWSFLDGTGKLRKLNRRLMRLCFILLAVAFVIPRSRRRLLGAIRRRPEFYLLLISLWAALLHHAFQSHLAWGASTTNAWYAMLGLPVLVLVLTLGAWSLWRSAAALVSILFVLLWSVAHFRTVYGALLPHQTNTTVWAESLERVAAHHDILHFTGRGVIALEVALIGLAASAVVIAAVVDQRAARGRRSGPPTTSGR